MIKIMELLLSQVSCRFWKFSNCLKNIQKTLNLPNDGSDDLFKVVFSEVLDIPKVSLTMSSSDEALLLLVNVLGFS